MPAGRPTDYRPEYCEAVIEFGARGKSMAWMAAELDVSRECIYEWMRVHPEFSDAITRAKLKSQQWWEDVGQENLLLAPGQGTFNATTWAKNVSNRFREDWSDERKIELTGANGGPVEMRQVTFVAPDAK